MPENDWSQVSAALVNGAMQLGNSIVSDRTSYEWSKKFAEEQNKRLLENWNLQNEYNSPKSQMQRLVDAGLNPNLMYGQMSSSNAGDIGTPATAEHKVTWGETVKNAISSALDMLGMKERVRNMHLQNEKLEDELNAEFGILGDESTGQSPISVLNYRDYLGYRRMFEMQRLFYLTNKADLDSQLTNWNTQLKNEEYNLFRESKADRLRLLRMQNQDYIFRQKLQRLEMQYRDKVNNWYNANQVFNMADRAAGRVADFIPFGRLGKSLPSPGKWLRTGSYKDSYGGTTYEYEKFY